jgi:hypothetical protein
MRRVVTVLDRYGHVLPGPENAVTDALDAMAQRAAVASGGSVVPLSRGDS